MLLGNKHVGWAIFSDGPATFSDAFQTQLSEQLSVQFYRLLGVSEDKIRPRFALFVDDRLQPVIKDEHAFGLVSVNTFTYCYTMTIYWRVADKNSLATIMNNNLLTSQHIEFGWCTDFEREGLLASLNNRKKLPKEKYQLGFEVEYDYSSYPDLSLGYSFIGTVSQHGLFDIENSIKQSIANTYVSSLTFNGKQYIHGIDFQNIPFNKGRKSLLAALQQISTLPVSELITKIIIE